MNIYSIEQVKKIEKLAIETSYLSEDLLMENAAHAVLRVIIEHYKNYNVRILCGPGNNGADGLALARILTTEGCKVSLSFLYTPDYKGTALKNYQRAKYIDVKDIDNIPSDNKTLIVDALFGIGLNRTFDDKTKSVINSINRSQSAVLSIDIPSGISGTNGKTLENSAVYADKTVTFVGIKLGMLSFPANDYCGEIITSTISISKEILDTYVTAKINTPIKVNEKSRNSHKCSNGKILTIAGSKSYYGAPYFSSKAALLSGAGFSVLISHDHINNICATLAPEVIYRRETDLITSISNSNTVIIGPGIGLDSHSKELLIKTINASPKNLILDADALTLISEDLSIINAIKKPFVITPHPGEMARLTGQSISEVENNRINISLDLSKKTGAIVVLKGVFTVITTPNGDVFINETSSRSLATAGSGDILCGIIAGLSGYNSLINSVKSAIYIHGLAGIIAEKQVGETGVTASDIMQVIPQAITKYKNMLKGKVNE